MWDNLKRKPAIVERIKFNFYFGDRSRRNIELLDG
tara:strand:- start:146 stop:250 length:105 start_codon:yes stop_codon:yes gene_type:complete